MDKLKSKLNYYKERGCNLNSDEVKKILDELEQKDKMIDEMAEDIIKYETELGYEGNYKNKEEVIKYFEERCK